MAFSSVPKRFKIVGLFVFIFLILCQLWSSIQSRSTEEDTFDSLITEEQQEQDRTETTNLEKQSLLYGFQGFKSKLPQLQYDFPQEPVEYTNLRESRRDTIKQSFLHAWKGYKTFALGHDELLPLTNRFKDPFGGWGATLVDSLSTLLVMDLETEFLSVMPKMGQISFKVDDDISVFESIIRYLGGFLSAFELSDRKQDILIKKAEKLAEELLPAFDTPSGLPHHFFNPLTGQFDENETLIAEVGTLQLEFMMLSQLTGNLLYGQKAQEITDLLDDLGYEHGLYIKGLYPTKLDTSKARFNDAMSTFGAMGDSIFEYFLKEYLLMDGAVPQYGRMYRESISSMKRYMLRQVPGHALLLLPPYDTRNYTHYKTMDHLTCFAPGMLAMGAVTFNEPEDMEIAKQLLETCVYMYRTTETGLSPESWMVSVTEPYNPLTFGKTKQELAESHDWWRQPVEDNIPPMADSQPMRKSDNRVVLNTRQSIENQDDKQVYFVDYQLPSPKPRPETLMFPDKKYMLRPETVESLFILYRMTGDQKYQEYGWEIYQSIEKWCKTKSAYAAIRNVERAATEVEKNQLDSMESFLLAETFKYLYLLFSPPDIVSLDKFIFNTEAHPFIRKHWNWEKILNK